MWVVMWAVVGGDVGCGGWWVVMWAVVGGDVGCGGW